MFAEASATSAIRLVRCKRSHDSQALIEKTTTTMNAVVRITALSSAATVRRLSMKFPQELHAFGQKRVKTYSALAREPPAAGNNSIHSVRVFGFRRGNQAGSPGVKAVLTNNLKFRGALRCSSVCS